MSDKAPIAFVCGVFFMGFITAFEQHWFVPSAYMQGVKKAKAECEEGWKEYLKLHPKGSRR